MFILTYHYLYVYIIYIERETEIALRMFILYGYELIQYGNVAF